MNIPEINIRVKKVVEHYSGGNVRKFAEMIKVKQQTINRLFNIDTRTGKYPVATTEILVSITEMFVEINSEWLLTGKGEMLKKKSENFSEKNQAHFPSPFLQAQSCETKPIFPSPAKDFSDPKFNSDFSAADDGDLTYNAPPDLQRVFDNFIKELEVRQEIIRSKDEIIKAKNEVIMAKDEAIKAKDSQIEVLSTRVDEMASKTKRTANVGVGNASDVDVPK